MLLVELYKFLLPLLLEFLKLHLLLVLELLAEGVRFGVLLLLDETLEDLLVLEELRARLEEEGLVQFALLHLSVFNDLLLVLLLEGLQVTLATGHELLLVFIPTPLELLQLLLALVQ